MAVTSKSSRATTGCHRSPKPMPKLSPTQRAVQARLIELAAARAAIDQQIHVLELLQGDLQAAKRVRQKAQKRATAPAQPELNTSTAV